MSTTHLSILLGVLLLMSAFFSGSETALMRVSPYRLRALARRGSLGAKIAEKLLARPDRLIGLILAWTLFPKFFLLAYRPLLWMLFSL